MSILTITKDEENTCEIIFNHYLLVILVIIKLSSNIKLMLEGKQNEKFIYQMHVYSTCSAQVIEVSVRFNSEAVICRSLVFMVKVTSGYTEWILTQNCTKEKTTCVNPVGGGDTQFKTSNYTFHLS